MANQTMFTVVFVTYTYLQMLWGIFFFSWVLVRVFNFAVVGFRFFFGGWVCFTPPSCIMQPLPPSFLLITDSSIPK